jgi:hypothetical protein
VAVTDANLRPAVQAVALEGSIAVENGYGRLVFDRATGAVAIDGLDVVDLMPRTRGCLLEVELVELVVDTPVMSRVVQHLRGDGGIAARLTWDVFQTRNVHVYVRVDAERDVVLEDLELPAIAFASPASSALEESEGVRWAVVDATGAALGVVVKKHPWVASWNDVGAFGHRTLGAGDLREQDGGGVALAVADPVELRAGQTIESALFLRRIESGAEERDALRAEATYAHPDEVRYVPEGEFRHQRVWETERVWLGPPIFDGCPQRPYDQLIPRPLGLNVLARKRFTWSNEDFSLWRLTGKDRYWESGIKKAFALLETQNEHGGWWEGIEFYNLPPKHHHMYDTYISGMFLLEAYDETGFDGFLEAAGQAKGFWLGEPPANGHVEVADGAWWYRWGGYVNEFGHTDQRCVLNTHSGATAFLALYAERTGDPEARQAAEAGIAAVRWGLERGIQRGDGQFLYCLSQVDPTLERPGDPPYIRLDLVPQIEDVYTVASSYRLLLALRTIDDADVRAAIRRALDYWWVGHRAGTVYTYRAYAVIGYGVAAGEIDLRYALALPEILRDPQQFTSLQRGHSSFVAPHGLPRLFARVQGAAARFVEPVFLRRRAGEYLVALVNVEQPLAQVPVAIEVPAGISVRAAQLIDPAADPMSPETAGFAERPGAVIVTVPDLQEFAVTIVRLELDEGPADA